MRRFLDCRVLAGMFMLLAAGTHAEELLPGLVGEYFESKTPLGDFMDIKPGHKPWLVRIDKQVNFEQTNGEFHGTKLVDNFYARWSGTLRIAKAGRYIFITESDDGSRLFIDGKLVVDNGGPHGFTGKSGDANLSAGDHAIKIEYFEGAVDAGCVVSWEPPGDAQKTPGASKTPLPASVLFHDANAEKILWDKAAFEKAKPPAPVPLGKSSQPLLGRHSQMDYGPFLSSNLGIPGANQWTVKGINIKVGDPEWRGAMCFDTELLRFSAGWDGFVDWKATQFSMDQHVPGPNISGELQFSTACEPGWAKDGSFADPRKPADGPLPADWAKFRGLYRHGQKVVLSYTVGDTKILELPGWVSEPTYLHGFTRTLSIGPSAKPLVMKVCDLPGGSGSADGKSASLSARGPGNIRAALVSPPAGVKLEVSGEQMLLKLPASPAPALFKLVISNDHAGFKAGHFDELVTAAGAPENLEALTKGGPPLWPQALATKGTLGGEDAPAVRARIQTIVNLVGAPGFSAAAAKPEDVVLGEGLKAARLALEIDSRQKTAAFEKILGDELTKPAFDLAKVQSAAEAAIAALDAEMARLDAYVVDTLTIPKDEDNPWKSWMRLGGMDFFADGKRAAVSTWSGDVWIVSGIDEKLENLSWRRYASGLFQPLGLKIVDDVVYTLGRDQITRLHDLNKDGEADFYENFNNDCHVTTNFHEFTFDLQTDAQGNFYYAKGSPVNPGGRGFMRISAHNGCLIKVSKDGSKLEVYATGLRAPNGIGIGPDGQITSGDNQGTWVPLCPINWIKPGGFVGVVDAAHRAEKPTRRDDPICWMPFTADNSGGGQVWVTSDKWGPFKGDLLHTSYGTCSLFKVMFERVGETVQGGTVRFPLRFQSGVMRPRFNPVDGQLYLVGLKGWQTTAAKDGAFHRVRYTGRPVRMPTELHVRKGAIDITFTCPLDPATAGDAGNYAVEHFNVLWTQNYGSDEFSIKDPKKKGHDPVPVESAKLSPDGRTLRLSIPTLQPVTNMIIRYRIKSADGVQINSQIYNTIHMVP